MADDVAAAMIVTMDDDELSAYVAELSGSLGGLPQGHPDREPLLLAYGRACGECTWRGLPDSGNPTDRRAR